jgi:hypothetical protein
MYDTREPGLSACVARRVLSRQNARMCARSRGVGLGRFRRPDKRQRDAVMTVRRPVPARDVPACVVEGGAGAFRSGPSDGARVSPDSVIVIDA